MKWIEALFEVTLSLYMDVSKNRGTPKWMVKIMENSIKMDDLGIPLFLETPLYVLQCFVIFFFVFSHSNFSPQGPKVMEMNRTLDIQNPRNASWVDVWNPWKPSQEMFGGSNTSSNGVWMYREKQSIKDIKDWMRPLSCDRAIRYSGCFSRSINSVGRFGNIFFFNKKLQRLFSLKLFRLHKLQKTIQASPTVSNVEQITGIVCRNTNRAFSNIRLRFACKRCLEKNEKHTPQMVKHGNLSMNPWKISHLIFSLTARCLTVTGKGKWSYHIFDLNANEFIWKDLTKSREKIESSFQSSPSFKAFQSAQICAAFGRFTPTAHLLSMLRWRNKHKFISFCG